MSKMGKSLYAALLLPALFLSCLVAAAQSRLASPAAQTQWAFRHIDTSDGLCNNEVLGLRFSPGGTLLIETLAGWNEWDGKEVKALAQDAPPASIAPSKEGLRSLSGLQLPKKSTTNTILDTKDDGKGNLWIATDHEGVYIYNKVSKQFTNLVHTPSQSTSIAENHVSCIAIAKDGTVALGHIKKGISIHTPLPFRLTHFQSDTWRNVSAVLEDHTGDLWIGTDGHGLFNVVSRKHVEIPGNIVVSLLEDHSGRIWVGTYKQGLLCLENGKVTRHYTSSNSPLSDNSVYSLCQDRLGRLWIGTLWGHLQSLDPDLQRWEDIKVASANESIVMDFAYDGKDELLAGTLWGLTRIDIRTGECRQVHGNKAGKPFLHEDIQSLHKDGRGLLWIAHGKGMSVWDTRTDSLRYITKEQGLCDEVIRSICEDGAGRIWIGTSNGLSVADGKGGWRNFTTADGLLDDNLSRHSMIRLRDGNLILGSYEGYSFANLTGQPHALEKATPYEIGEEWTVWTSWQAMLIYATLLLSILTTYLLMRRAKRKAIAAAIKKAEAVWKSPMEAAPVEVAPSEIAITSMDEQLVRKAVKVVEDNISNDLTVEQLAAELALTRGHLYKKLTALTGKTPMEFIRTIRMKRACQLLDQSGMRVSEIAYAVGYSSPKIFSRNFKAEMGMTPTEYLNKKQ